MLPDVLVRPAITHDLNAILDVERAAFGRDEEADLVAALLDSGHSVCNLVALLDGRIVGHVLFTAVQTDAPARLVGLAPLAVEPASQQSGVGMSLVSYAWPMLRDAGFDGVVVLGDPAYYGRFGFTPADQFGLRCDHTVLPSQFMACPLADGALNGLLAEAEALSAPHLVTYAEEFDRV